jgi:hypothetical protein
MVLGKLEVGLAIIAAVAVTGAAISQASGRSTSVSGKPARHPAAHGAAQVRVTAASTNAHVPVRAAVTRKWSGTIGSERACGGEQLVAAGADALCPFARNVLIRFDEARSALGHEPGAIVAYDPQTRSIRTLECSQSAGPRRHIQCGVGASYVRWKP